MNTDHSKSFGILIAYILPGFAFLLAVAQVSPVLGDWISGGGGGATPLLGGVLYMTAASIGVGMIINTLRWLLIDSFHHATGLQKPELDDGKLQTNLDAFARLVEDHFRYHQFYANTALAIVAGYPFWRSISIAGIQNQVMTDGAVVVLVGVLIASSRDALKRYYERTDRLMNPDC